MNDRLTDAEIEEGLDLIDAKGLLLRPEQARRILEELRDVRQYAREIYDYMATRRMETWDEFELRGLVEYAVGMPIPAHPSSEPESKS